MKKLTTMVFIMLISLLMGNQVYAQSLGTAFTYQGKLNVGGLPANGIYDLEFKLYDALTAGSQIDTTKLKEDVNLYDGYFTVSLDFGVLAFNGDPRWLQIAVRPGTSTERPTALTPRQQISPTPYAIRAATADSLVGGIGIDGSGSTNFVAKFTGAKTLGNSQIYDNGTNVGIGTTSPDSRLAVNGLIESETGGFKFPDGTTQTTDGTNLWQTISSKIYYDAGLVGVGTTNPTYPFEVVRNVTDNINPTATFRTTGTNSVSSIKLQSSNTNFYTLGTTQNNSFGLAYNKNISLSSDLLRITPTGWFGINA
ncbi:MAG: hypothetical protein GY869_14630, partial [Planctomycetes bacterium]|nr:hypothetical protein [Planctomycetota bacterium]